MIVRNRGLRDPGSYFFVANQELIKVEGEKPEIEGSELADPEFIRYPSRDGKMIPAYLTVPRGNSLKLV